MPRAKVRVLIMESNDDEWSKVCAWLESDGWEARRCEWPYEAQSILRSSEYDVLVVGIRHSDAGHLSFLDWVLENCPGISIVVVTDAPFSWLSGLSFIGQVQFCLQKPVKRQALEKALLALKEEKSRRSRAKNYGCIDGNLCDHPETKT